MVWCHYRWRLQMKPAVLSLSEWWPWTNVPFPTSDSQRTQTSTAISGPGGSPLPLIHHLEPTHKQSCTTEAKGPDAQPPTQGLREARLQASHWPPATSHATPCLPPGREDIKMGLSPDVFMGCLRILTCHKKQKVTILKFSLIKWASSS